MLSNCEKRTCSRKIVVEENKSRVDFENLQEDLVLVVEVDGCVLVNEEACDYLVQHAGVNYYIELKGGDIEKALRQISASIAKINARYGSLSCRAVISATRVPAITGFQKAFIKVCKSCNKLERKYYLSSSGLSIRLS